MANEPLSDSLDAAEHALCKYLAAVALAVCDRWEADDVDDGAMGEDVARLRRIAGAVNG